MATPIVSIDICAPHAPQHSIVISKDLSKPSPLETIDDAAFSYEFTGKHDHGALPPIRADNRYGHLVEALAEAKAVTDRHILALMAMEAAENHAPSAKVGSE
jgi:hypothetical protein